VLVQAQGVDEREAEMFGGDDADDQPSDDQPSDDQQIEDPFTEEQPPGDQQTEADDPAQTTLLEEQFEQRLQARSERALDIGGGLFSQLQYSVLEEGSPEEFPLSQPNFLDVYMDARPNQRLRVYADGRLSYTPTTSARLGATDSNSADLGGEAQQTEAVLDELWVKFDIDREVFVTAGRQHLRWGVGRFWFPNDFLFEQRRDPLALFDVRTGVDIVKLHYPVESLGWNFYGVANLGGADSPEDLGGAARAEFLAGLTEFAFSAAAKRDDPLQLGFDISTGIGWFDLRAAVAVLHDLDTPFFRGASNFQDFDEITLENVSELQIPEQYSREDDWIPRALVGGEVGIPYGEDDTFYVGAEYFYNDAGYSDPEIYPWLIFNGAFRPLYTGRHYASLYALIPSPGEWDDTSFSLSTLGNLSDRSFLSRIDYSVSVLTHMRVFAFGSITYGADGEFTQGFRVPAISADVIGAAQAGGQFDAPEGVDLSGGFGGFSFPATRAALGGGLSLNF
jgi:hypothetical protein